jgi:hypothetical protein
MGEKGKACRILVGKPEREIPLKGPRRKEEDNTVKPVLNGNIFRSHDYHSIL